MTPVMLLTDGFIANAAEPWSIPDFKNTDPFPVAFRTDPGDFHPYVRDPETLARHWAISRDGRLEHRVGGLEKDYESGNISYDSTNHQRMTDVRRNKINGVAKDIPPQAVELGNDSGKLAVVGWGSTYGAINRAVDNARKEGLDVSHIHLRHIWPLAANLGALLAGFDKVLVPEMNTGQLVTVLRSEYLVPAQGLNKVSGLPFRIAEIEAAIHAQLEA